VSVTATLPPLPARVHFVGIGGIGMSGLARILQQWGYEVSGSDGSASPMLDALAAEGITVAVGHTMVGEAAAADLVVMTAAVNERNPEVAAAIAAGVPVLKRAALLGALMNARRGVAVAGSHGKSTTSGMITTALLALGADPSYAVGATVSASGTNAAPGSGETFVVEADEYDRSFLHLHPEIAVVTNVEYDHPDIYPTLDMYDEAFAAFLSGVRPDGTVVLSADDPGTARIRARADVTWPAQVVTFGTSQDADWRIALGSPARVTTPSGEVVALLLAVPGEHNVRNATAALAAIAALGYPVVGIAEALGTFRGVGRRFDLKGVERGVTVVDDYAHHPTEIQATLRAAKERYPGQRIVAAFQPHTYSRLKALLPEFAAAFGDADVTVILDIYASRETDTLGIDADDLRRRMDPAPIAAGTPEDAAEKLAGVVRNGDIVLTMGAGSITETGPLLLERLRRSGATGIAMQDPELPGVKILRDSPMRLWTTWNVGGTADRLIRAGTPDEIAAAAQWGVAQGLPVTVIGGGSNLLVGDGGIRGLVVLARTPGERAEHLVDVVDEGDSVLLTVGANAPLSWTGRYAAEHGWAGLDWAVGLPGTIGGATVNNAGAHGVEQKDHLIQVEVLDLERGERRWRPATWLDAAYRHTVIKAAARPRSWVVLRVQIRLPKGDAAALTGLADEHAAFRKRTQPGGATGGSTFANPPGDYAGRLLEAAGMKGYRIGGAAFSTMHANWIVNDQQAQAADIRALIRLAKERVETQFGVALRQEVEEIGEA